jgi:hypothetical protein
MDADRPDGSKVSSASGCPVRIVAGSGVRSRLRLRLGLRLLSAVEDRSGRDAGAEAARRLPSVRALAAAASVHRNTAAAVYGDLERFGLVRRVRGAGTFAVEFPTPWVELREPACRAGDLADVLAAELGRPVSVAAPGVPHGPLLVPLDESPPREGPVVPVAPLGRGLRALRRLPAGSTVRLVSTSPRLGRLVRHTILALHGDAVGLARTPNEQSSLLLGADLGLVDLRQFDRRGTDVSPEGLIPLRLLVRSGRRAG